MKEATKKYKNVYCVCNEATDDNCDKCKKWSDMKPTNTFQYKYWKRKV